jgi:threonine synthase
VYTAFGEVLERIGELKVSLSAQFIGAEAYRKNNRFVIKMGYFFAKRFAASEADIAIVRGIIAEKEGILIGISSGAALCGAVKLAKEIDLDDKIVVVIAADSGEHYLSVQDYLIRE